MASIEKSLDIAYAKMKKFSIESNDDLDLINKFVFDRKEGKLFENRSINKKAYSLVYDDKEYNPTRYGEQVREDILSAVDRLIDDGFVNKNVLSNFNVLLSGPAVAPDEIVLKNGKRIKLS